MFFSDKTHSHAFAYIKLNFLYLKHLFLTVDKKGDICVKEEEDIKKTRSNATIFTTLSTISNLNNNIKLTNNKKVPLS